MFSLEKKLKDTDYSNGLLNKSGRVYEKNSIKSRNGLFYRKFLSILGATCVILSASSCAPMVSLHSLDFSAKEISVNAVTVELAGKDISPKLQAEIKETVEKEMAKCATGKKPVDMKIKIDGYREQTSVQTFLIGDSVSLGGTVLLSDAVTKRNLAAYHIKVENRSVVGGTLGLAFLVIAENKLPDNFADKICEDIFQK